MQAHKRNLPSLADATKTLGQPEGQKLVTGVNELGFKLLPDLSVLAPQTNLCVSPASIAIACSIAATGAKGDTKTGIEKTFGADGIGDKALQEAARSLSAVFINADPKVDLQIANSLWAARDVTLKSDFLDQTNKIFDADVSTVDFGSNAGIKEINDWVSQATKGHITSMIDSPNSTISLMILDAVYFKAPWSKPFDKRATADGDFHLVNMQTLRVPMMHQSGSYPYAKTPHGQILSIPYAGGRLAMQIYLPDEDSNLTTGLSGLDADSWSKTRASMSSQAAELTIPKFKTAYRCPLLSELVKFGMATAANRALADFSGISATHLYISDVLHKTTTEVSEEGTVATAATSISMKATMAMPERNPPPPIQFIVDRPFLYAITDSVTGAILFVGLVYNPQT
jgi:serpin B